MQANAIHHDASAVGRSESIAAPPAHDLPDDLWLDVFAHGTIVDLANVAQVSHRWQKLAQTPSLSRNVLQQAAHIDLAAPQAAFNPTLAEQWAKKVRAEAYYERGTASGPLLLDQDLFPDLNFFDCGLALSPKDRWLGLDLGQASGQWKLFDLHDLEQPSLWLADPSFGVNAIVFSPNESLVALVGGRGCVRHYALTLPFAALPCAAQHQSCVEAGSYNSDSSLFASVDNKSVILQNLTQPSAPNKRYELGQMAGIDSIAFASADSNLVIQDGYGVTLIDLAASDTAGAARTIRIGNIYPRHALFTNGCLQVVVWDDDGTTGYYDGAKAIYEDGNYRNIAISGKNVWDTEAQVAPDMSWVMKNGQQDGSNERYTSTLLFDLGQAPDPRFGYKYIELHHASRPWSQALFAPQADRLLLVSDFDERGEANALHLHSLKNPAAQSWSTGLGCNIQRAVLSASGRKVFTLNDNGDLLLWALPMFHE